MDELRELDAEIHVRVMGCPLESRLIGTGDTLDDPLRPDVPNAAWRVKSPADKYWDRWSPTGAERIIIAPRYTTDISAAMSVVEKMEASGFWWEFSSHNPIKSIRVKGSSYAEFWHYTEGVIDMEIGAEGATLSEAICRAALAAVEDHP